MNDRNQKGKQVIVLALFGSLLFAVAGCGESSGQNKADELSSRLPEGLILHEEELSVAGLSRDYHFLLLADSHIAIKTEDYLNESLGDAQARIDSFVNEAGTVSSEQFPLWIQYANDLQSSEDEKIHPDAMLFLGDILDYYTETNADYLLENLQELQLPYLFTLGNHDLYTLHNEVVEADAEIYQVFQDGNTIFQSMEFEDLIVVAINDESYDVNYQVLEPMEEVMKKGKPIILLAHVPLYNENVADLYEKSEATWGRAIVSGPGALGECSPGFIKMITAKDSPVVAVLTGDNHFYYKGALSDQVTEWVLDPAFHGDGTWLSLKAK